MGKQRRGVPGGPGAERGGNRKVKERRGSAGKRRPTTISLGAQVARVLREWAHGAFQQPIFARPDLSHTHFSHAARYPTRTARSNLSSHQSVGRRSLSAEDTTKLQFFNHHAKDRLLRPHLTSFPPKAILGLSCERRSQACAACTSPMTTSCMPQDSRRAQ